MTYQSLVVDKTVHLVGTADRLVQFTQGAFNTVRSGDAALAVDAPPVGSLAELRRHRHCLVVTYRRSGEGVPTPVWFGLGDGIVYFRSVATNGKVKRIRHTPRVRVAPCNSRGVPLGAPFLGLARIVSGKEEEEAERSIRTNHGLVRRAYNGLLGNRVSGLYIAVTPTQASDDGVTPGPDTSWNRDTTRRSP